MKKSLSFFIIALSLIIGTVAGLQFFQVFNSPQFLRNADLKKISPDVKQVTITPQPLVTPTATNIIIPIRLVIPKLKIDAVVEQVGIDEKKNMDVPKEVMNVAWYNLGYRVGEKGNAVIAGHLDQKDGSDAVFANLSALVIGDKYSVFDQNGKELIFQVTGKRTYETESFPIETVFGSHQKARLNLITCSGTWSNSAQSYSSRTVVFSELIK